ncbi:TIGR03009 domain-containing protein [Lignipirellula cremea]|uniref:TIGR03009 domain-containing protein n=1 Tax=Lignipirellula cremea TaxID=2528010 RepID=UPI0018D2492D|nr:TIGR03009 domain-containing protein [Lignipirellula cremea]
MGIGLLVAVTAPAIAQQSYPQNYPSNQGPQTQAVANGGAALGQPFPQNSQLQQQTQNRLMPAPFGPLTVEHTEYLDKVLGYWEYNSKKIQHYECQFRRWDYDPVWGPKVEHMTYSTGIIKYADPDKGLFEVQKIYHYRAPEKPGDKPQYLSIDGEIGEKWICDGRTIFEFKASQKELHETQLPPAMQGKAIVDGPLPFMFGAEAAKIKARYWVHVITPTTTKGEYWLEAFPKYREDAANFQKIHIIIDSSDFLPKALQVYPPNYHEVENPKRTVLMFDNRNVNSLKEKLRELNLWSKAFFDPATPAGWVRVQKQFGAGPGPGQPGQGQPQSGPATNTARGPNPYAPR